MDLRVSQKIIYSELIIGAVVLATLIPYELLTMDFTRVQTARYLVMTLFVLAPLGMWSLFYFMDRWECRPIVMLSFFHERGMTPPDGLVAAACVRALNLPLIHAVSIFVRYELICVLDCGALYALGLPSDKTLQLFASSAIALAVYPVFSFFLTERLLAPARGVIAGYAHAVRIDPGKIFRVGARTRIVTILLTTTLIPLVILSLLTWRVIGAELAEHINDPSLVRHMLWQLADAIFLVIIAAILLAAALGGLVAGSISRPLEHMTGVIRRLEKDGLHHRMHFITNDEFGVLSRSFDSMTDQLEKSRAELEAVNRTLEQRVAEKTRNLTLAYERIRRSNLSLADANRKLESANEQLTQLDRLKSDFLSVVAHEIRTPLTSIKAFTEAILLKPNLTGEKREQMLRTVNAETDRLTRLVNAMLDLTRIESGGLDWHIEPLSPAELARSSVAGVQALADNKNLAVVCAIPETLPCMRGDRDRVGQVLMNLLSNAIKFSGPGGTITVSGRTDTGLDAVAVSVTDTGPGIPEQDHELIFDKFRRSRGGLSDSADGTGLGLAISRQIVEQLGGKIWVESTPGRGCTFTFALPLCDRAGLDIPPSSAVE
jgi:signal transduction histidine kinase